MQPLSKPTKAKVEFETVSFRARTDQVDQLKYISELAGIGMSEALRQLVDNFIKDYSELPKHLK